ncbi:hypothetical protein [Baaleninema sp.]|uniref:hypothetical protein n=1 Tax=Baaleninema sp. TaxID=3101197 RepID=UPI003CFD5F0A
MTQHHRIQLEDAIEDYAAGLLTATIAYWIRIHTQQNQVVAVDRSRSIEFVLTEKDEEV